MSYNFSAGPAMLPEAVKKRIHDEWMDWDGFGSSVTEISHRGEAYQALLRQIENNFRHLLNIPENYHILFMHGGAVAQFAMVPMNLLGKNNKADYLVYGHWARRAFQEAERYGDIHKLDLLNGETPQGIIPESDWQLNNSASYCHYCSNETVDGMMLPFVPKVDVPLVADMSSDILMRNIDVSQYGLIYACTQKTLGVSGLGVVILRDDLLDRAMELTPTVFSYKEQAKQKSVYNTINTFACYVAGLVCEWVAEEGGVAEMVKRSKIKAKKLYDLIDASDVYTNKVSPEYRSTMNVTFYLQTDELEARFLKEADEAGLKYLRGHRVVGGCRVSIYNAMPEAGVDALVDFMKNFERSL